MSKYRLITALAVSALFLGACEESDTVEDEVTETDTATEIEEVEQTDEAEENSVEVDEDVDESTDEEETDVEEVEETNDDTTELPEEIEDLTVTDVRDDTTGNWKKVVTPSNVNMPDNAMAYYDEYMEEGEVHYIISFATNTTTMISDIGLMLMVEITEYEDREEHSADTIGSGMLYGSYNVYLDNGDVEELEVE